MENQMIDVRKFVSTLPASEATAAKIFCEVVEEDEFAEQETFYATKDQWLKMYSDGKRCFVQQFINEVVRVIDEKKLNFFH